MTHGKEGIVYGQKGAEDKGSFSEILERLTHRQEDIPKVINFTLP